MIRFIVYQNALQLTNFQQKNGTSSSSDVSDLGEPDKNDMDVIGEIVKLKQGKIVEYIDKDTGKLHRAGIILCILSQFS